MPRESLSPDRVNLGPWRMEDGRIVADSADGVRDGMATLNLFYPANSTPGDLGEWKVPRECTLIEKEPKVDLLEGGVKRASYPLKIVAKPDSLVIGNHQRNLLLFRQGRTLSTQVTWEVKGSISCNPDKIHFGMINRKTGPIKRLVTLQSTGQERFAVKKVTSDSVNLMATLADEGAVTEGPAMVHLVALELRPDGLKAEDGQMGTVRIEVDNHPNSPIQIHWSVFVREFIKD